MGADFLAKVKKKDDVYINDNELVTVTVMGHLVEVQHMQYKNNKARIQKVSKETYVNLSTGELKEFNLSKHRGENYNSLRQTFKKLRYLINNNFTGADNELFITLTYRGDLQTSDHKKVGYDYNKFFKRLKYAYGSVDAIKVLEPHETGNYHMHVLMKFNDYEKIYIPNHFNEVTKEPVNAPLYDLWGNGYVTIKSIKGVDNVGAYLTAYLTDIELTEQNLLQVVKPGEIVEIKEVEGKKFVKGGRLKFYPPGVNIFTKTKGVLYPEREHMDFREIKKVVGECAPNYQVSFEITDDDTNFSNTVSYLQYNLKR